MSTGEHRSRPDNDLQEVVKELEKFRQIVENTDDAVVTINENSEVVYMNLAAEEMFGYDRREIMGGPVDPLIPIQHRRQHTSYVQRLVRTGRPHLLGHEAELEGERRDGTNFPVHLRINQAETDGGLLFTAMLRDLSQERTLAEQVKRSEKLALIGQMVATVGHEIRHPLTLIGGFARQLAKDAGQPEPAKRKLQIIVDEVARLEKMLTELNDMSRPTRYNWEGLDLRDLLDHVLELMEPELSSSRVKVNLTIGDQLPKVVADRDRMSQVMINLFNNAVHAGGNGSMVDVQLRPDSNGGVIIEIRDQGPGITPEQARQVFQPFYTTKKGGTGLGLPVAQRIVEDHDGQIELQPGSPSGAVARIHLPGSRNAQPPDPQA